MQLSAAVGTMDLVGGLDTFSVSNNNLGGTIPPALFAASIQSIDLSENNFFGNLPPMSDSLVILNVERNSLSGPITELGNAVSLETVKIANNAFNGQLPAALFSRPLQELDLGNNFLAGIIPSEISQATLLKSLRLGPNRFSGALPSNINALTNLESLSIFKIPGLDGRLPGSFGLSLTNLVELIISETLVRGDIPSFFGGLTRLVTLDLSSNLLRSELPRELGLLTRLSKYFASVQTTLIALLFLILLFISVFAAATLYLDNNDFNGPIPAELGRLTRLTELLLHNNAITGSIPSELGGLVDLSKFSTVRLCHLL
jgi:Leucine-rich repeat (LRR) protein